MAQMTQGDPSVGHEEEVTKLPEAVEVVGKPTLWHDRPAIVIAAWAVIDAADSRDATSTVPLARVTDGLDDLLVLRQIRHALRNVFHGVEDTLRRLGYTHLLTEHEEGSN